MSLVRIQKIDPKGLLYRSESESGKIRGEDSFIWSRIESIKVFKRDLFTCDLICMTINFRDSMAVEVDEDDAMWDILICHLHENLEGALSRDFWFNKVAFPAFDERETIIFRAKDHATRGKLS